MARHHSRNDRGPARWIAAGLAACALAAGGASAGAAGNDANADPIGKLAVYAGSWNSRIVHYRTTYTQARVETTLARNDCWRSDVYYACDQFINGRSAAFVVYTYSAGERLYHIQVIPKNGVAVATGTLAITGNAWTFPWQYQANGKTIFVKIVNVFPDTNTIEFHEAFSYDRKHWTPTADGVERRTNAR
jgi:hypothetical protein